MSKHDFSREEFAARREAVSRAMSEQGLEWLVLFHPVSIRWLTGSDAKSYQEFQCLIVPASGPLTIMAREGERNELQDEALVERIETFGGGENEDPIPRFERLADELGLLRGRCSIEVPAYYLHPHHYVRLRELLGSNLAAEATNLVHDLSLVKSPAEIDYVRKAHAIADAAMAAFVSGLRPGRSELALAGDVYAALLAGGSGLSASPINLVAGERSGYSHGAPTERLLKAGDFGSVEYGATWRRYTATIGRQFCLGPPTPRMRELYDVARRACDACIAEIRDGAPATAPHEAAKRVIGAAGLEHGRVHTSGYGLAPGFPPSWGEPVHMIGGSDYVLRAGMVLSVEPPVFLGEERLGARIIDNVLVTHDGSELLSRASRDLIVAA
ncbi:M24 family metallopeptidase [Bosea sp. (in: a-proteobacteria)]|uniref:M24 family metallopeptidase n=1 Tax=Bosea sp. (in: a-proteobacteria) TaxID=1871050 RepID=UPI002FC5AB87